MHYYRYYVYTYMYVGRYVLTKEQICIVSPKSFDLTDLKYRSVCMRNIFGVSGTDFSSKLSPS